MDVTPEMADAIGAPVLEAHLSRDLVLVVDSADTVLRLAPDMERLKALPGAFAVIATARGEGDVDFVSRFFAPGAGIPEDPVTGSSHSTLIPFWSSLLGKDTMLAKQLSKRGGTLYCRNAGSRVVIGGYARLYLRGTIEAG
jgi:Predicted epimerase, PhzC/PhzF homolog